MVTDLSIYPTDVVSMLTRQEKVQLVVDLYNQGKTIREIAKEVRMAFRDIGTILRKEEKQRERQKRQEDNNMPSTDGNRNLGGVKLSTKAYELFSQGKNPIQVAIELNLKESQVTDYYKEYLRLNNLHKLNKVHDEIKDDISYFLELYRSSKVAGMSADHVMRLLEIANDNLPALEGKYKKLEQNVNRLEFKQIDLSINLVELKSQIQDANQMLNFYHQSSQKEVSKFLQLYKLNTGLDKMLKGFKNNNKDYNKIQFVARQAVESVLLDNRRLLKLAIYSISESWQADPARFNLLNRGMSQESTKSIALNFTGNNYLATNFSYSNQNSDTERLAEIIVNEAVILYEKMVEDFTNETMTNMAMISPHNISHREKSNLEIGIVSDTSHLYVPPSG
jgi:predicted transcriptional regulator